MFTFSPGSWNDSCDQQIYIITVLNPSHPPMLQIPFFCCFICMFQLHWSPSILIQTQANLPPEVRKRCLVHDGVVLAKRTTLARENELFMRIYGLISNATLRQSCRQRIHRKFYHWKTVARKDSGKSSDLVALPVCSNEILFNIGKVRTRLFTVHSRGILSFKDSGMSSDSRGSASLIWWNLIC